MCTVAIPLMMWLATTVIPASNMEKSPFDITKICTIVAACGKQLQLLHNIVVSSYHCHSSTPHDAIVVVAYKGVPQQLDAGTGIENHITTFHTSCGAPL
jgi:hypothetical protein